MNNLASKINELTKKLAAAPDNDALFNERAGLYQKLKEYEKSKKDAYKCLEIKPESAEYLVSYGNSLAWLGDYGDAIEYFSNAIDKDDTNPYYYHCRGNCYQRLNEKIIHEQDSKNRDGYTKSLEDYDRAIRLNPSNAEYYYLKGISYGWLGDFRKSHESYGKALEINPDDTRYLNEFEAMSAVIEKYLNKN